jgi:glyoxylase-like metal-dependent hydrolase (beta-lactamase superfamily II)
VDANYPARAKELLTIVKGLSPKPVRFVFDTHARDDHSYGNSVWTKAGARDLFREVKLQTDAGKKPAEMPSSCRIATATGFRIFPMVCNRI